MSTLEFDVKTTTRNEFIDVTRLVRDAIRDSGVVCGIAAVFCPHTTAGITLQENTDPTVKHDIVSHLSAHVPESGGYTDRAHAADNTDAHIKSSLVGASLTLIVENGRPVLGPWQAVFFCEFDGPRSRRVLVRSVSG